MSRRWKRSVQQNKVRHVQIQGRACIMYITLQIVVSRELPVVNFKRKDCRILTYFYSIVSFNSIVSKSFVLSLNHW